MTTEVANAAFSGEVLFRAAIVLRAPGGMAAERLLEQLERLSNDMVVDIQTLDH
jgi:glycine cleavage system regulatory protein